ncbi:hypothetical protein [Winogradskyella sp.]|jgi:hypothetical protein|uniref:hypothetical protein n=1 Tax=Winogradskyella sp. TaxID=1883156 RepID=UPI0025D99B91|nr:hypothetical protein [Winogradskyella sp.]MCT4630505.1 hypothetical protein [Winogradskyella sp.]
MAALIIIALLFVGLATYAITKISISCVFWSFNTDTDKRYIFKRCFPYYIISLTILCIAFIIEFDKNLIAIYYFSAVYFLALFIWRNKIKPHKKKINNKNFAAEPNQTHLP